MYTIMRFSDQFTSSFCCVRQDIDRKGIKIKRNSIYLDNKIYGSYNGSQFHISGSVPSSSVQATIQLNVPEVISRPNQLIVDSISDKSFFNLHWTVLSINHNYDYLFNSTSAISVVTVSLRNLLNFKIMSIPHPLMSSL